VTIITYAHRPKRTRKRKAQTGEIAIPRIVKSISRKAAKLEAHARANRPDAKPE
jgi:hypothetical protein